MQLNGVRLRAILAEEAERSDDLSPAGDAAILAHLRFVAEALAANAAGDTEPGLANLARELPDRLTEESVMLELDRVGDATAADVTAQFGEAAPDDPALTPHMERTVRIVAWTRAFLRALDAALPADRMVADAAIAWMDDNQRSLADTIFAMDRRAKQAERERGGPDAIANQEVVNRIGQAVVLQARTRFLVEALATTLGSRHTA